MPIPKLSALIGIVCLTSPILSHAKSEHPAFLFYPDIHKDEVVFTSEGDLWLGSLKSKTAVRITSSPGVEDHAHFSPDGKQICFSASYNGAPGIFVMNTSGGAPRRVVNDDFGAVAMGWTPDGKNILFASSRSEGEFHSKLYSVPAAGGLPKLLPIPDFTLGAMAPDGIHVAYVPFRLAQHWYHYRGGVADHIWLTNLKTNHFKELSHFVGVTTSPTWCDGKLYCVSEQNGVGNLYSMNTSTGVMTQITHYVHYAVSHASSDGTSIIFQHGTQLGLYVPSTHTIKNLTFSVYSDHIHARPHLVPLQQWMNSAAIGPTGKRLVIEARGQLASIPAKYGVMRMLAPMEATRSQHPVWSPDGKQVAFVSDRSGDEEVWICNSDGTGTPKKLTSGHKGPINRLIWSPDGKMIAFGDHEMRIYLVDVATGKMTLVDQSPELAVYNDTQNSYRFSPDSKWLTYAARDEGQTRSIYLYNIASAQKTIVSDPSYSCGDPTFSSDGKFLLFVAERNIDAGTISGYPLPAEQNVGKPTMIALASSTVSPFIAKDEEEGVTAAPTKPAAPAAKPNSAATVIDLDGISDRLIDLPLPGGNYNKLRMLDGKVLALRSDAGGTLISLDVKTSQTTPLSSGISNFRISSSGQQLLIYRGNSLQIVPAATGPFAASEGAVPMAGLHIMVNPKAEWKQIFNESWRILRDYFYDPAMHGLNWDAVYKKYDAQLPGVEDRSELNYILGNMMAELNVGHAFVGGGDYGVTNPPLILGYLGAHLAEVPNTPAFKIVSILPGNGFNLTNRSPLLAPGLNVKVGDYILAVNGQPVSPDNDIENMLIGTAGQTISLTVNSRPDMAGSRVIYIKPLNSAQQSNLLYHAWVAKQRAYVLAHGGPNILYLHLSDMEQTGMAQFYRRYFAGNRDHDGMIFDVRYNVGGSIDSLILPLISFHLQTYFKARHGHSDSRNDLGFNGYMTDLCNQYSFSDAEVFSDAFQRLHLGPVIGERSWGGSVGPGGGYRLLDGGTIYPPNYGLWAYTKGKSEWAVEGTGVYPNIPIKYDPAAELKGDSPVLDKAIEVLKAEMAAHPVPHPSHPVFPNKAYPPLKLKS